MNIPALSSWGWDAQGVWSQKTSDPDELLLFQAVQSNDIGEVTRLLSIGVNPDGHRDSEMRTLLHWAASRHRTGMSIALLEVGPTRHSGTTARTMR